MAHVLRLDGDLDVAGAAYVRAAARAAVRTAVRESCDLVVDLSLVEFIDAFGISLLLGIRRAAADAGLGCELVGASARVRHMAALTRTEGALDQAA